MAKSKSTANLPDKSAEGAEDAKAAATPKRTTMAGGGLAGLMRKAVSAAKAKGEYGKAGASSTGADGAAAKPSRPKVARPKGKMGTVVGKANVGQKTSMKDMKILGVEIDSPLTEGQEKEL